MTTYTTLATSDLDPDSPVTTTLMNALANNPLAIAENDETAPAIVGRPITHQVDTAADGNLTGSGDQTIINATTIDLTAGQTLIVLASIEAVEIPGGGTAVVNSIKVAHNGTTLRELSDSVANGGQLMAVSTTVENGTVDLVLNISTTGAGSIDYFNPQMLIMVLDG